MRHSTAAAIGTGCIPGISFQCTKETPRTIEVISLRASPWPFQKKCKVQGKKKKRCTELHFRTSASFVRTCVCSAGRATDWTYSEYSMRDDNKRDDRHEQPTAGQRNQKRQHVQRPRCGDRHRQQATKETDSQNCEPT